MAAKMGQSKGSYNQTVKDSGEGQSKSKFGGHQGGASIKDSGKHNYNQKSGKVKDSGEKMY